MADKKSILTGMKRGLFRRCPDCGKGPLFSSYLKIRSSCPVCGADNGMYPSDDFPPYLTMIVVGHVVVPLLAWSDRVLALSLWLMAAGWIPATLLMCLLVLPFMKGATIGLCWAMDIVKPQSVT